MNSKLLIMSFNRKYLFTILAMIFLLTVALTNITLSEQSQPEKQNVLRQASLEWMQVGVKQYQSKQFADAEKSFRRALVFKKYLTEAERLKINNFLTKARIDLSEDKQPVENAQPAKAEEKIKDSEPLVAKEQQQTEKEPKIINSQIEQKVQPVKPAEPEPVVPEIQVAEESPVEVIVIKDKSFRSKLIGLSDWLLQNRRNVLLIGLPLLAVLVIISRLQKIKIRPGRRVYANYAPASSSFIGAKLADVNEKHRTIKGLKRGHSSSAVAKPKRKSFEQSTEHWKKNAVKSLAERNRVETKEKWPQQKDKSAASKSTVAKAGQKQCRKCKQFKPHSDFYKNRSSKDGLASWCKQCMKEYSKKRAAQKK